MLAALDTVRDPELDEPVTDARLRLVVHRVRRRRRAGAAAAADVLLRAELRVPDGGRRVRRGQPVSRAYAGREVVLDDHFASDAINSGVAARSGFVESFEGLADGELDELRTDFVRKAVLAGTDRVCRPLLAAGTDHGRPRGDDARRRTAVARPGPAARPPCRAGPAGERRLGAARRRDDRGGGRRRGAAAAPAPGPADPGQHRGERQHVPRHAVPPLREPAARASWRRSP